MRSKNDSSMAVLEAVDKNLEAKIEEEIKRLETPDLEALKRESEVGSKFAKLKILLNECLIRTREIDEKIFWFQEDKDVWGRDEKQSAFEAVKEKIDNTSYYKNGTPATELNDLREKFSEEAEKFLFRINSSPPEKEKFIRDHDVRELDCFDDIHHFKMILKKSKEGEEIIKKLINEKIESLKNDIKNLEAKKDETIGNLKQFYSSESYPIVWIEVGKTEIEGSEVRDDFRYGSKKPEKEVYKPYSQIHKSLIEANWAIRDGEDLSGKNYVTAHILFVVSDKPHQKEYDGGRTHIDFPINVAWKGNWGKEEESRESARGISIKSSSGGHSEKSLADFLKNAENVKNIVQIFKEKLHTKFGISEGFKVYEVNLFINSNNNVCEGCEQILKDLQSSEADQSFLKLLKSQIDEQGLKSLTKQELPRMIISASAYKVYRFSGDKVRGENVVSDATKALDQKEYAESLSKISIDTKPLSRKAILSTDEVSIDPELTIIPYASYGKARSAKTEEILEERGVPFHSAFTSNTAKVDLLTGKRDKYQQPESFDGVSNIPSTSTTSPSGNSFVSNKRQRT